MLDDRLNERITVGDRRQYLEVVVAQEPYQTVAQERQVLGDDYAHGSSAVRMVGPPGGLTTRSVPSSASTRPLSPRSPPPSGSAPPTPSSMMSMRSTGPRRAIRI